MKVVPLTAGDVEALWPLVEATPQIFPAELVSRAQFEQALGAPGWSHWLLREGQQILGLFSVSDIVEGWQATIHNTWFDGVLNDERAAVWLQWMLVVMEAFDLQIARGFIPANRRRSVQWFLQHGLQLDGVMRLAAPRRDGSFVGMACLSMTLDEVRAVLARPGPVPQLNVALAPPVKTKRRRKPPRTVARFLKKRLTTRGRGR